MGSDMVFIDLLHGFKLNIKRCIYLIYHIVYKNTSVLLINVKKNPLKKRVLLHFLIYFEASEGATTLSISPYSSACCADM